MSLVGVFSQSRPSIGGEYFDAVLEESTELQTDISEFPLEDGSVGNDHAVHRPLRLTMTIGVSDNPFRVARAKAGEAAGALAGVGVGVGAGLGVGRPSAGCRAVLPPWAGCWRARPTPQGRRPATRLRCWIGFVSCSWEGDD